MYIDVSVCSSLLFPYIYTVVSILLGSEIPKNINTQQIRAFPTTDKMHMASKKERGLLC
jgi:hypothetical protein